MDVVEGLWEDPTSKHGDFGPAPAVGSVVNVQRQHAVPSGH